MNRRRFITLSAGAGLGVAGWQFWPEHGLWNPCLAPSLPAELAEHELVQAAWEGVDRDQVWDTHVHLIGTGDGGSGIWVNPNMQSVAHPVQYAQFHFYLNAACADPEAGVDASFLQRLSRLHGSFQPQSRLMLLAFDWYHDTEGRPVRERSTYHCPNDHAADVAAAAPERFRWIASIHPYREDCVEALHDAVGRGAQAVKWLPPAMGMDPASPRCDRFYEALARSGLPLLTHAGDEHAVDADDAQALGNPLHLRRALDHGVTVIVAHCASLGDNVDLDQGGNGPRVSNFQLFARLMDEPHYEGLLFGEISATTQVNRDLALVRTLLERGDWHHRLVNGSDYPLPAVMPLFEPRRFVAESMLSPLQAELLGRIRPHNPLLFDFLLKRWLRHNGNGYAAQVFESARIFPG